MTDARAKKEETEKHQGAFKFDLMRFIKPARFFFPAVITAKVKLIYHEMTSPLCLTAIPCSPPEDTSPKRIYRCVLEAVAIIFPFLISRACLSVPFSAARVMNAETFASRNELHRGAPAWHWKAAPRR